MMAATFGGAAPSAGAALSVCGPAPTPGAPTPAVCAAAARVCADGVAPTLDPAFATAAGSGPGGVYADEGGFCDGAGGVSAAATGAGAGGGVEATTGGVGGGGFANLKGWRTVTLRGISTSVVFNSPSCFI